MTPEQWQQAEARMERQFIEHQEFVDFFASRGLKPSNKDSL